MAEGTNGFTKRKRREKENVAETYKNGILTSLLKIKKGNTGMKLSRFRYFPVQVYDVSLVLYTQQFYFKNQGSARTDIGRTIIAIGEICGNI